MSSWTILSTDRSGVPYGELVSATNRQLVVPHLRVPTFSFDLPLSHPRANYILDRDTLIKIYRGNRLIFFGPVITAAEQAGDGSNTLTVNATGVFWRLTKRIIPGTRLPEAFRNDTVSLAPNIPDDMGNRAQDFLVEANNEYHSGILPGTYAPSLTGTIPWWYLKPCAEAISEMSAVLGSYEFRVRPIEPVALPVGDVGEPVTIGMFDVAPQIGVNRPNVVFEYGTGAASIQSYQRLISRENLLTDAFGPQSGWPTTENTTVLRQTADDLTLANTGMYQEAITTDLNDTSILSSFLKLHVDIRETPRKTITFKPTIGAPFDPFTDYDVGDFIRARAIVNGRAAFDAVFRVWGITVNLDDNGNEQVELEVTGPNG